MEEITHILNALDRGKPEAAERLLPLVYDELRQLAVHKLAQEPAGQTLQPTALVHEAYLRLVGHEKGQHWDHRGHFFAAAATAMRRILVEAARRKRREKHGGTRQRRGLDEAHPPAREPRDDLVALDTALTKLAAEDSQAAKLVELRHFGGLSMAEAAYSLGISPRTADRVWAFARAWLHRELSGTAAEPES